MRSLVFILSMCAGICVLCTAAHAQEPSSGQVEEKLYNFDDMLIDGAFRDPQGMFERARADVQFEGVLNLERSFLQEVEACAQEPSMRP